MSAPLLLPRAVGGALAEVARMVVVEPVRGGRMRAAGWPAGLRAVVALALTGLLASAALVLAAPALRRRGDLVVEVGGELVFPRWTVPVFLALVVLTLALLHAACLHLAWWLRVGSLLLLVVVLHAAVFLPPGDSPGANAACWVGCGLLLALTLARWRASFAWWEPVVVLLVLAGSVATSVRLDAQQAQSFGYDPVPTVLVVVLVLVSGLSVPFTFVAGLAFAQLATLLAHRVGDVVEQRLGPTRLLTAVALVVGLGAAVVAGRDLLQPTGSGASHLAEWGASALLALLVVGGALALVLPHAPAGRSLDVLEDAVSGVALPAALLVTAAVVPSQLATLLSSITLRLGTGGSEALADLGQFLSSPGVVTWTRIVVGGALVAWALLRRTTRPLPALLAAALGLTLLVTQLGPATGDRVVLPWTTDALVDVVALVALATLVGLAATRRLTRHRVAALGVALGVCLAFGVRSTFDAPFVAVLGLGSTAAVFIGVLWATLTGAADANGDTARWPRPSRVLLFLANALLAMVTLAFLSVSSVGTIGLDVSPFATLGDAYLGTALLLSALAVLARETVRPGPPSPLSQ